MDITPKISFFEITRPGGGGGEGFHFWMGVDFLYHTLLSIEGSKLFESEKNKSELTEFSTRV